MTSKDDPTHLVLWNVSRALELLLSDEEQKVVSVRGSVCLEEEVTHEEVGPVGGPLHHNEARVCRGNKNWDLLYAHFPIFISYLTMCSSVALYAFY